MMTKSLKEVLQVLKHQVEHGLTESADNDTATMEKPVTIGEILSQAEAARDDLRARCSR